MKVCLECGKTYENREKTCCGQLLSSIDDSDDEFFCNAQYYNDASEKEEETNYSNDWEKEVTFSQEINFKEQERIVGTKMENCFGLFQLYLGFIYHGNFSYRNKSLWKRILCRMGRYYFGCIKSTFLCCFNIVFI